MATTRTTPAFVIGNWKMNGMKASISIAREIADGVASVEKCAVALCPPFTLISAVAEAMVDTAVRIGGQDCHSDAIGAHTGDISAAMLSDAGARYVILGHSERRRDHREKSALIAAKLKQAAEALLFPVVCIGETEEEHDRGRTLSVVRRQLRDSVRDDFVLDAKIPNLIVAYEPVWAIGTGRTPTLAEIAVVHAAIRAQLKRRFGKAGRTIAILYGGSVKASNAAEIFGIPNVNGALVGGASLKADDFLPIVQALERSLSQSQ